MEWLPDRIAFFLMDVASLISRPVWMRGRGEVRPRWWVQIAPRAEWYNIAYERGLLRWIQFDEWRHDGWRPARYV